MTVILSGYRHRLRNTPARLAGGRVIIYVLISSKASIQKINARHTAGSGKLVSPYPSQPQPPHQCTSEPAMQTRLNAPNQKITEGQISHALKDAGTSAAVFPNREATLTPYPGNWRKKKKLISRVIRIQRPTSPSPQIPFWYFIPPPSVSTMFSI